MSASDGYVATTTKVVDHGPDNLRWNLVIVGDGYQVGELDTYHADVENFLATLRSTSPFDEMFCGINVHRIDVVSNQSGADIPECAVEAEVEVATYFDATFCSPWAGSPLERLLTIDSGLALDVASARVPEYHQVMCIVNSSKYGGAGGTVATTSTDAAAAQIAIHEIGHSAFGLADEYGGDGTGTPAGEPVQPNVTRDTNRATNKWNGYVAAGTPMPSQCDASCAASTCVPPATAPAAGAVGTYEGGIYSDCNTYRPLPDCYMRTLGVPFCPVCADVIRATLSPFMPAETIQLLTSDINFQGVPAGMGGVGVTTHRAIVWDVVTCRELTFEITAGPSGGFGTPFGTSVTVTADPILPMAKARLWLSYTSTNVGDSANGSVTVQCVETGESWVIDIEATTVARPRTAVSLVLDRSGSMDDDAGDAISKVTKLREAADAFISIMLPDDGIGVVRFNQDAQRLLEITDAGAAPDGAGRVAALDIINSDQLEPNGQTSIGDGVVDGRDMLDDATPTPPYDERAMVVLTDGQWNQPPSLDDVSGSINAQTYAVGLGLPSNISVPALTQLCQGNDGYMLVTGALDTDQSLRLSKYFLQILAGVNNAEIAADPSGTLRGDAVHRIPFHVTESDFGMDLIVLCEAPQLLHFELEAPDGTRIQTGTAGNLTYVRGRTAAYYRCALPVLPANSNGTHSGRWHAVLTLRRKQEPILFRNESAVAANYSAARVNSRGGLFYEFVAHTYSTLRLDTTDVQKSFEPGAIATLVAGLQEFDAQFLGDARCWVELTAPNGQTQSHSMVPRPDGTHSIDVTLNLRGVYTARVRAAGNTLCGERFERERTHTLIAVPGADRWDPKDPGSIDWCELLRCIKKEVINDKLIKQLAKRGLNLKALLACLERHCPDGGKPGRPGKDDDCCGDKTTRELLALLRERLR